MLSPERLAHWSDFPIFYEHFFHNRIGLLVLFGLLAVGLCLLPRVAKRRAAGFPLHEIVLAGLLTVFPIFTITLAIAISQLFFPRYAIFAMGGIVIVAILLIDAVAPNRQMASLTLLVLALFVFGMDQMRDSFNAETIKAHDAQLIAPFAAVPPGMPLVIASGLAFLPAEKYASDSDMSRTFFLTDRAASIKYSGSNIFDKIPELAKAHRFRGHFADYATFIREHKKFYAFGPYVYCDAWQIQKLKDDGARIVEKGSYPGELTTNLLVEVELP